MSIEKLESIHGLDVASGLNNCMDDESLYLEVLKMFALQLEQEIDLLNDLCEQQQWQDYGKACHAIKGAAISVGASLIHIQTAELEEAGKNGNANYILQSNGPLIEQLNAMKSALSDLT